MQSSPSPTPPQRPSQPPQRPPPVSPAPPVEADLLNLGMPSSDNENPVLASTPPTINPDLDIFANSSQQENTKIGDDLFAGFGSFVQAPPPPTTPVAEELKTASDLLFGQNNGDLLFEQSKGVPSAPKPTPTAEDMLFDPFGSKNNQDNLIGTSTFTYFF